MEDRLLPTGDVARLLGVSTETIRRWIKMNLIEYEIVNATHVRRRRLIRIRESEVQRHQRRVPVQTS